MTSSGRLRLDEVISSVPELGPTIPDGGYAWIILIGTMAIQITVPSIVSMYGVILGFLIDGSPTNFDMWKEEIALTPILFTAFWNLADPWTRVIINLASVPRIIGLIGVCLLAIGVLASGYLATGGVGAYLASSSAGAVMGIGGSFILVQTDSVLRRNFRTHLQLVLLVKEIATSLGFIIAPGFIYLLLSNSRLHLASLLMACIFIPTALGSLVLRYPTVRSRTSPYTLLISEDDNELTSEVNVEDVNDNVNARENNSARTLYSEGRNREDPEFLFGEGSEAYSYQGPEEDQELFNVSTQRISASSGWRQTIGVFKYPKVWIGVVAWIGCKASPLFIYILLPSLVITALPTAALWHGVTLSMTVAIGTILSNIASLWRPNTARMRSIYFGALSWLACMVLLGLSTKLSYSLFLIIAFLGGISIGGTSVFLESAMLDLLGNSIAKKSYVIVSTIAGLFILCFVFIRNPKICLQLTAVIQFIGGCYWSLTPLFGIIQAR